jgi:multisubunit Na+/H+ antiporter MnhG subunit
VSVADILVIVLLAFGVAMELTSVLGILVGADVYARLHFTGPASTFTPLAFAVAIAIHYGAFSQAGIQAAITAALIVLLGPALVHATARAARIRQKGEIE